MRGARRSFIFFRRGAFAAFAFLLPTFALAQSPAPHPTATLVFQRTALDADCPDESGVRTAISARLEYDPFTPDSPLVIHALLERRGPMLHAVVRLRDARRHGTGMREIRAHRGHCAELTNAMALAVSIAIDPLHANRAPGSVAPPSEAPSPEPSSSPPPAASSSPPPVEASSPPPPVTAPIPTPWRFAVGLGLEGWLGVTPSITAGADLFARVGRGPISVALELHGVLPQSQSFLAGHVLVLPVFASIVACYALRDLDLCAIVSAGAWNGNGSGYPFTSNAVVPLLMLGPRAAYTLAITRLLALRFRADVQFIAAGANFTVGTQSAWTSGIAAASLGIDAVVRIP